MFPTVAAVIEGNDFEKAEQVLNLLGDIDIKLNAIHSMYVLTALQLALTNGQFIDPENPEALAVELFARDLSEKLGSKAPALRQIVDTGWAGVEQARARAKQHQINLVRQELDSKTFPQLKELAREHKVRGFSKLKIAELKDVLATVLMR